MYRFEVSGMTCGHCTSAIEKAIKTIDPQAEVSTDIENSEITVRSQADEARISGTIREAGYDNQKLAG
ncbi:heavy-metal-associated domain-containing protein [Marinobacter sp. GN3S48]|uniref:heavy-metal-associated domain-containing protein n=1 Tax=Marinobacter sp. GN3S48 TaxID=3382302 RepID=UPI00387B218D